MKHLMLGIIAIVTSFCLSAQAAVIHVPADQPTIQDGIDAATTGDTILVANGIYTGPGNRDISFTGKSIQVQSESGFENCIIDCQGNTSENHRGFIFESMESSSALLMGFTIQNGYVEESGGGILCNNNSSPIIIDCKLSDNIAMGSGGGISLMESNAEINNCIIMNNSASYSGGLNIAYHSAPLISFCVFEGNSAENNGGAITVNYYTQPEITHCRFHNNTACVKGGALYFTFSVDPIIGGSEDARNEFSGNFAPSGSDLAATTYSSGNPINTTWNQLSGDPFSDYHVCPQAAFDLSNCTALIPPITQDVYVLPTGDDNNSGLGWDQAFRTINHALSRIESSTSNPHTIWLGAGVYSPSTNGENYPIPIVGKVTVAGVSQGETILDAEGSNQVLIGYREVISKFQNLTIQGGNGFRGGAMYTQFSELYFTSCTFTNNHADESGGAAYLAASFPVFIDCLITQNTATDNGGGIFSGDCIADFVRCEFSQNIAETGGGGGFFNNMFGTYTFNACLFLNNSAEVYGGGISMGSKCVTGAMSETVVSNNSAGTYGGGLFAGWDVHMDLDNNIISNNQSNQNGGGLYFQQESSIQMANLTVANNTATVSGAGIHCHDDIELSVRDSIVWGNSPDGIIGDLSEVMVRYSDIQGGFPGPGNIDMDPFFVTGPSGEYYLSQISAGQAVDSDCLDAGTELAEQICYDAYVDLICMDHRSTSTDGIPDAGVVDLGYHYPEHTQSTPTPTPICLHTGDANLDNAVTAADAQLTFLIALGIYSPTWEETCAADCNGDELVTSGDAQGVFMTAVGSQSCIDPV